MHKLELEIISKNGEVTYREDHYAPAKWSELNKKHLLIWASVMSSTLNMKVAVAILSFLFYRIPARLSKFIPKSKCLIIERSIGFLFKRNDLEKWLIPAFWHRCRCYYGPKDKLANITAEEFKFCEYCYQMFDETKDLAHLDNLCAVLYRPRRWFNISDDIRTSLTGYGFDKRSVQFKKLKPVLKWAIYLNYEGCRNYIIRKNPDVFERPKQTNATRAIKITPWAKIIESAAGGAFGPYDQTEKANIHKFLSKLGQQIRDYKEAEQNRNK